MVKTLAVLAPLGAKADPRGPGLFGEIPSLRLQPHDGPGCLLAGEGLRVRIVPVGDELAIELWPEGVPSAASGTAAGDGTSAEAGSEIEGPVVRVFGQLEQRAIRRSGVSRQRRTEVRPKRTSRPEEHIRFARGSAESNDAPDGLCVLDAVYGIDMGGHAASAGLCHAQFFRRLSGTPDVVKRAAHQSHLEARPGEGGRLYPLGRSEAWSDRRCRSLLGLGRSKADSAFGP